MKQNYLHGSQKKSCLDSFNARKSFLCLFSEGLTGLSFWEDKGDDSRGIIHASATFEPFISFYWLDFV